MLSIGKTIELLGGEITPEQAEEIRSFTYELAELLVENEDYQQTRTTYEKEESSSAGGSTGGRIKGRKDI